VASSIVSLLSDLSPSSCSGETSKKLLKDIFAVAGLLLRPSDGSPVFDPLLNYLQSFIHKFGEGVEKSALAAWRGSAVPEMEREIGTMLKELLLATLTAARNSLGDVWTSASEQNQGESAFESESSPTKRRPATPNDTLTGVFALLKNCLESCPVFIFHLPAASELDKDDEMLLRRALHSAVASINDVDPSIARSAMSLLKTAVSFSIVVKPISHSFRFLVLTLLFTLIG
jgi:hypothetical protein